MTNLERLPHVEAELNYLVPMAERPRYYAYEPAPGEPRANMMHEAHTVPIHDMRPIQSEIGLDSVGFALVEQRSGVRDFWDDDEVRRVYYPEAERFIAEATSASRVFIFDHLQRRRVPGAVDRSRSGPRQPATRVHVDHTAKSGPQRVRDLLGGEAEELLRGRVQVINMWRPIRGPLRDAPLAVCDAHSVDPGDLVPSDLVYRDRVGETYSVTYNPAHRWFYVPEMRADEALLQWKLFVAVHTNAPMALSRALVHDMMRQKWGRIVKRDDEPRHNDPRRLADLRPVEGGIGSIFGDHG